jgi:Flp pilus assembly protein TadB
MNLNFLPLLVVWIALALVVLALFIWRQSVSRGEDDSLHVMHGALTQQTSLAQKLDVIDKWGKILTVITVLFGLLLAAAFVYGQFVGRASVGA